MVEVVRRKNSDVTGEERVKLNNGNYVVHYDKNDNVINTFIVTSFRGPTRTGGTGSFCSLINLDTGYIQFDENCSRSTTIKRVLSHLNPNDYSANNALKSGQRIEVFTRDEVTITLNLPAKKGYEA